MSLTFINQSPTLDQASAQQRLAQDTEISAWVAASAGAGKTRVLTARILRLLIEGAEPGGVLALTYTRAAAKEMQGRLIEEARKLALCNSQDRVRQVQDLLDVPIDQLPELDFLNRARGLYERILDTPGGLQIQTIHAFCQSLLGRFPFEAGISPGFQAIEEETRQEILQQVQGEVLAQNPDKYHRLKAQVSRENLIELSQALLKIDWSQQTLQDRLVKFDHELGGGFSGQTTEGLERQFSREVESRAAAFDALAAQAKSIGKPANLNFAKALENALDSKTPLQVLAEACLNKEGLIKRAGLGTKELSNLPLVVWLDQVLPQRAAQLRAQRLYDLNVDVLEYGTALARAFATEKRRRAALDFDDLIDGARQLLNQEHGPTYVQYRLDQRIEHILLDEAQDTSAKQWQVIAALAEPFFDDSSQMDDRRRTLFVVGDFKQSIYSFQGAAPHLFSGQQAKFKKLAQDALHPVSMAHSFRSAPEILGFVDALANNLGFLRAPVDESTPAGIASYTRHQAVQTARQGVVQVWPVPQEKTKPAEAGWQPLRLAEAVEQERAQLGRVIARHIHRLCFDDDWAHRPEAYLSLGRRVTPGDFMVLVQNRKANFADALIGELKALHVPVTGVDRLKLNQELLVKDLLALAEVCLQPLDDLALAALLKSPLYGFHEDALFTLSHNRGTQSLMDRLRVQYPDLGEHFRDLARQLGRVSLYDFFSRYLFEQGKRALILAKIGPEAEEVLTVFLERARAYDLEANGDMLGFVEHQRVSAQELKRDTSEASGQVRLMTVHGAKGLEAPIVILPDLRDPARPGGGRTDDQLINLPKVGGIWVPNRGFDLPQTVEARHQRHLAQQAERERLFYVALTRAEERLIICSDIARQDKAETSWYNAARTVAKDQGQETDFDLAALQWSDGPGFQIGALPDVPKDVGQHHDAQLSPPLPAWMFRQIENEAELSPHLRPSSLLDAHDPETTLAPNSRALALQRGVLIHAALEHLSGNPRAQWGERLDQFFSNKAPEIDQEERETWSKEVLEALNNPDLAGFFGPTARAEVNLTGTIDGHPAVGQIDRLHIDPKDKVVRILDYKTNRPPPPNADQVSAAYLAQLRGYTAMLTPLYPDYLFRTYLFWTHTTHLMDVTGL